MRLVPLTISILLLAGCAQPSPPGDPQDPEPCVPQAADPQQGTITTEVGEYNLNLQGFTSGSGSYESFGWDWPTGSRVVVDVRAEWDAGLTGEKAMDFDVALRSDPRDPFVKAYGPSPIVVNFTADVPLRDPLYVSMRPRADTFGQPIGVAVAKAAVETHVTMVQTLLCPT